MDFDFSDEQHELRHQVRKLLARWCPASAPREILEGVESYDRNLWRAVAEMGLTAIAIPENYGGLGLAGLELCVVAEELGRALAPIPFSSSVYLATEFLLAAGSPEQKEGLLPRLASGEAIGCLALSERSGVRRPAEQVTAKVSKGRLSGVKTPVADGDVATFAVVAARTDSDDAPGLFLVDLSDPGVQRETVRTIDPTRSHARITFRDARAEPMVPPGPASGIIDAVRDRASILIAFEQLGGAERALEMARDYALERIAFGRQIGSFQSIKHMLANMYVATTLARSNCYFGAWALSSDAAELPQAAAAAHLSATEAFQLCSKNSIQIHGGAGFTWNSDCGLFYRRANLLALSLGGPRHWQRRLVDSLRSAAA
ncbi:acyl-CoA dehydrogenase family protein [Rhizorhabdus wittichii]|uniref:acyl-CoA dehydrogenase family protein n=1 Tax=Rhizorhabdus wittichii TaxID=160791 RepID=UPI00049859F0|nr:acyl-CoA dehydrogenase family protein [Rhizorhabdus wittichii]